MKNLAVLFKNKLSDDLKLAIKNTYCYRLINLRISSGIFLKRRIRKSLEDKINTYEVLGKSDKKILVPLIESSHYQIFQVLLIAKALQLRGADVKLLVCGEFLPGCEIKSVRNTKSDPCLSCRMNAKHLLPLFGLDTVKLKDVVAEKRDAYISQLAEVIVSEYPAHYEHLGIDIIRIVNDSVTRYFYGDVPENNPKELERIRLKYVRTALLGLEISNQINESWQPDVVFGNMESYADWAPYHQYFSSKGKASSTISMSQFDYKTLLINQNSLFRSNERYLDWLNTQNHGGLNDQQETQVVKFIAKRFSGNSNVFRQYGFFDPNTKLLDAIKIDSNKRNIFLFSNVYWDVGMSEFGALYSGVLEWVIASITLLKDTPDCHLYVKPHPSELFDVRSGKGVIDEIYKVFPVLPDNLTIIKPEMKILTYDLFEYIDVGVVYNGTLGLEMLFHDIPVIACGKTPYGGINLVSEPDSEESYLELLLGETDIVNPSKSQVSQFAYFYFIKTLIPWNFTKTAYGDVFSGFNMQDITGIMPNSDHYLDHICKAILEPEKTNIDNW